MSSQTLFSWPTDGHGDYSGSYFPKDLTRATVADGKQIQKDTIQPLVERDELLKEWLESQGDGWKTASAYLDRKIDETSANVMNTMSSVSAELYSDLSATSAQIERDLSDTSANLFNIMSGTSALIERDLTAASASLTGLLEASASMLSGEIDNLEYEFSTWMSGLSANVSSNFIQKGQNISESSVGQIAVWESGKPYYKLGGRNIETNAANIITNGENASASIPTVAAVAGAINTKVAGLFKFQGSESVSSINAKSKMADGDVYNIFDSGKITKGAAGPIDVYSGDNIVWVKKTNADGYWDKMAATFDDSQCMKIVSSATSGNIATFVSAGQLEDSGLSIADVGKFDVLYVYTGITSISEEYFWTEYLVKRGADIVSAADAALDKNKGFALKIRYSSSNGHGAYQWYAYLVKKTQLEANSSYIFKTEEKFIDPNGDTADGIELVFDGRNETYKFTPILTADYTDAAVLIAGNGIFADEDTTEKTLTLSVNLSAGDGIGIHKDELTKTFTISAKGASKIDESYYKKAIASDCYIEENYNASFAVGSGSSAFGKTEESVKNPGTFIGSPAIAIGHNCVASAAEGYEGGAIAIGLDCEAIGHTNVAIGYQAKAVGDGGNFVIGNNYCEKLLDLTGNNPHGVFHGSENLTYDSLISGSTSYNYQPANNILLKDCAISGTFVGCSINHNFLWNNSKINGGDTDLANICIAQNLLLSNSYMSAAQAQNNFVAQGRIFGAGGWGVWASQNINFGGDIYALESISNNNVIFGLGEGKPRDSSDFFENDADKLLETSFRNQCKEFQDDFRNLPIIFDSQKCFVVHDNLVASSTMTHVFGEANVVSSTHNIHVRGNGNYVSGAAYGFIDGIQNQLYDGAYIIGQNNFVSGTEKKAGSTERKAANNAFVIGVGNSAVGPNCFEYGLGLLGHTNQVILGRYNKEITVTGKSDVHYGAADEAILIVGNGGKNGDSSTKWYAEIPPTNREDNLVRNNAFVVYQDGHGEFDGDVIGKDAQGNKHKLSEMPSIISYERIYRNSIKVRDLDAGDVIIVTLLTAPLKITTDKNGQNIVAANASSFSFKVEEDTNGEQTFYAWKNGTELTDSFWSVTVLKNPKTRPGNDLIN